MVMPTAACWKIARRRVSLRRNASSARSRASKTAFAFCNATERRRFSSFWSSSILSLCQNVGGHLRALDARADFGERGFARSGGIVAEGRESAVIGRAELFERDVFCGLEHAIADFFGSIDARI